MRLLQLFTFAISVGFRAFVDHNNMQARKKQAAYGPSLLANTIGAYVVFNGWGIAKVVAASGVVRDSPLLPERAVRYHAMCNVTYVIRHPPQY